MYTYGICLVWAGNTRYKHYGEQVFASFSEAEKAFQNKIAEYKNSGFNYWSVGGKVCKI